MKNILKKIIFFLLTPILALFYCTVARKGDKTKTLMALLAQSTSLNEDERNRLSIITISYFRRGLDNKGFPSTIIANLDSSMQQHMYVWDHKKEFYLNEAQRK